MTRKPRRKRFIVELNLPDGATYTDAKEYIEDAVLSMKGRLKPHGDLENPYKIGHPMSGLDRESVKVMTYRKLG